MAKKKMPKRPKRPKASAGLTTWENYSHRVKEWEHKCSKIHSDHKKKESLMNKFKSC